MLSGHAIYQLCGRRGGFSYIKAAAFFRMGMLNGHGRAVDEIAKITYKACNLQG